MARTVGEQIALVSDLVAHNRDHGTPLEQIAYDLRYLSRASLSDVLDLLEGEHDVPTTWLALLIEAWEAHQ